MLWRYNTSKKLKGGALIMKRIRKIFTLFIVICIMISSVTVYAGENGEINMRDGGRLGEAHVVAEYKLSEMKKNKPKTEYYYANVDDLRLADPFIIYIANQNSQDEIYEFPVYDIQTGKIIYIIDVFSVEDRDGFMCELSLGYVDELNDLDYLIHPDDVLIYRIGRTVCFEYDGNVYAYDKKVDWTDWVMSDEEIGFVQGTKETRKKLIHNRIEKGMLPASFPELSVNDTENALMNGNLTLYNPRLQYGYAMCWACAVATVYNYLTAFPMTRWQHM